MSIGSQGLISQDPMRQQRLANMICFKCGQKGHMQKDSPNASMFPAGTPSPSQDQQY